MQTSSECIEAAHATLATSVGPALIWVIPGRPETTKGSPVSPPNDIGLTYASVLVEVRARSVVSTVYNARFGLQAARLPMRLTRVASDRPRMAWSLQLSVLRHSAMRVGAAGPIPTSLLALVGPTRAVLAGCGD